MPVQLKQLTLATLAVLDPRIEGLFQKELATCTADLINRPREKGKRKVMLEFEVVPVFDPDTGECEEAKIKVEGWSRIPRRSTRYYQAAVSKAGLRFNEGVPEGADEPAHS